MSIVEHSIVVAICQLIELFFIYLSSRLAFGVLIECIMYTKIFMDDVKMLIDDIDRMAANATTESAKLDVGRKAVNLHNRVYE